MSLIKKIIMTWLRPLTGSNIESGKPSLFVAVPTIWREAKR